VNHDVVWTVEAYRALQSIWDSAGDREQVVHAIDEILDQLAVDAADQGESRANGSRVIFVRPLGVSFWANARTTEVLIFDVWAFT